MSGFIHLITCLPPGMGAARNAEYAQALRANLGSPFVKHITLIEEECPAEDLGERHALSKLCTVMRMGRRAVFNDLIAASRPGELNCIANADVSLNFSFGRLRGVHIGDRILAVSRADVPCDWSYDAWIYTRKPDIDAPFQLGRFSSDNALIYLMKRSGREVLATNEILLRHHHASGEHSAIWNKPVMSGWDTADAGTLRGGIHRPRRVDIYLRGVHRQAGLGDVLCGLSAAREYARRHTGQVVYVSGADGDLVRAYGDKLIHYEHRAPTGETLHAFSQKRVLNNCHTARNYLGFFYQSLGMAVDAPPRLELPTIRKPDGLPERYIALQPRSNYARNPDESFLREIVRLAGHTGLPIIAVGRRGNHLAGVDHSFQRDSALDLIGIVQNAVLVLTARSASFHVACENEVPVLMWSPDDRMTWPHNYPGAKARIVTFEADYDISKIRRFMHRSLDLTERRRSVKQNDAGRDKLIHLHAVAIS